MKKIIKLYSVYKKCNKLFSIWCVAFLVIMVAIFPAVKIAQNSGYDIVKPGFGLVFVTIGIWIALVIGMIVLDLKIEKTITDFLNVKINIILRKHGIEARVEAIYWDKKIKKYNIRLTDYCERDLKQIIKEEILLVFDEIESKAYEKYDIKVEFN